MPDIVLRLGCGFDSICNLLFLGLCINFICFIGTTSQMEIILKLERCVECSLGNLEEMKQPFLFQMDSFDLEIL